MKKRSIYCLTLLVFSVVIFRAQSALLATGADASSGNGSVSYSIGQTAYLNKGTPIQLLEGVQQGFEITTLSSQEASSDQKDQKDILIYPNPFKEYLYLDFTTNDYKNSEYQLFDSQGKLIKKDMILQSKSELNFSALPSAMYIIRISRNGENIKTFKIIKK